MLAPRNGVRTVRRERGQATCARVLSLGAPGCLSDPASQALPLTEHRMSTNGMRVIGTNSSGVHRDVRARAGD